MDARRNKERKRDCPLHGPDERPVRDAVLRKVLAADRPRRGVEHREDRSCRNRSATTASSSRGSGRVPNLSNGEHVDHHRPVVTETVGVYSSWDSPRCTQALGHAYRGNVSLLDVKDQ